MADDAPAPTKSDAPATPAKAKAKPVAKGTAPAKATKSAPAAASKDDAPAKAEKPSKSSKVEAEEMGAPKRPTLSPQLATLLHARRGIDRHRPIFGRQAANRYYRIGRDGSWRRPRGLQSKQRRHYGYRAELVSIGYGSPAKVRGLVPSGYRPIIVHTDSEIESLDPKVEAAIIARTVGTRRRLGLEETARKRGVRVLNPIRTSGEE
jgi:large subunit ribosomal protein L32e